MTPDPLASAGSWDRLVSTALVGTARRPVPDTPDLPETPASEGAEALLDRAALATVRRTAGYTPGTADPVTPDDSADLPEIDAAASARLEMILSDRPELLPEWLGTVVASGRRVARARAPELLERGAQESQLRPAVAAAVGGRGRWLARFNPRWAYVSAEPVPGDRFSEDDWANGSFNDRRRSLAVLRATDPDAARDLLTAVWADTGKVEQRRRLLDTLSIGLGPADADFLDQALDDRGANVRGLALSLLTRLPGSAHADRLRGYVRERSRIREKDSAGTGVLVVDHVGADRADVLRDLALVAPKDGTPSDTERAEQTWALVTHAPLDVWADSLGADPDEILARAEAARRPKLYDAFVNAVALQGDAAWSRAVYRRGRGSIPLSAILAPLPVEERCAVVLRDFRDRVPHADAARLAQAVRAPWTPELTARVLACLHEPAPKGNRYSAAQDYRFLCDVAAEYTPPEHHTDLSHDPPRDGDEALAYLRLRDTLRFRLDMHKEL